MTESTEPDKPDEHHTLRERIHERLVAAELAADAAAGFGSGTELVEAADAAAHPEHVTDPETTTDQANK